MVPKKKQFEQKAKELLAYLKSDIRHGTNFLPRPFMVEVSGTPSAGKSTMITELYKFFRRMGFKKVLKPQEGAEVIELPRDTPRYNIRTGNYALDMLLDFSDCHRHDAVIFDRCIFDSYCWMEYWYRKEHLTEEKKNLYQQYFLSDLWTDYVDSVFMVVCDPEEAVRRELEYATSDKLGESTNPKSIARFVDIWKSCYAELKSKYPQIHFLDTTKMSRTEMIESVSWQSLLAFERKVKQVTTSK